MGDWLKQRWLGVAFLIIFLLFAAGVLWALWTVGGGPLAPFIYALF